MPTMTVPMIGEIGKAPLVSVFSVTSIVVRYKLNTPIAVYWQKMLSKTQYQVAFLVE